MANKSHLSTKNYSRTRLCGEMTRIVFVSLVIIGYSSGKYILKRRFSLFPLNSLNHIESNILVYDIVFVFMFI